MNRQQMKELARRQERLKNNPTGGTEALVLGWKVAMDAPDTITVDVRCGCGKAFRFSAAPISPEFQRTNLQEGGAVTSSWAVGACPDCKRGHRIRTTIVVIVEEEQKPEPLISTEAESTLQS